MTKLGLIVTYFNCLDYTKNMLASIRISYPYELILIDDFSYDGSKVWVREFAKNKDNVTLIEDQDTMSLGEKWNLGVQKAKELDCEVVLICNNDILFSPNTIDNLIRRWEQGDVAMVSAHNIRGSMTNPTDILTYIPENITSEAPHPDFSCFMIDLNAWEIIGKFPTVYIPCYFEDNHIHTMLEAYGLKAIATTSAPYYHYGSITQNQIDGGLCKSPQFEANRAKYVEIFGDLPDKIDIENVRQRLAIIPVSSVS